MGHKRPFVDGRAVRHKIVRQPTEKQVKCPRDQRARTPPTGYQLPRNEEGGGAAVAKQAGLQASHVWSVLSVDGCYLGWSPKMIGDWHHGTPVFRARMSHNGHMSEAHDFKLALTRVIEPTGGPGAALHLAGAAPSLRPSSVCKASRRANSPPFHS